MQLQVSNLVQTNLVQWCIPCDAHLMNQHHVKWTESLEITIMMTNTTKAILFTWYHESILQYLLENTN